MMIDPRDIGIVSTGVYLIIPLGYTGFIQPKLGITAKSVFWYEQELLVPHTEQ